MPIPSPGRCDCCGLSYGRFRTGFTFADIVGLLWVDDSDPSRWRQKRRRSVLGFWHELKLRAWAEHLELCAAGELAEPLPPLQPHELNY